MIQVAESHWSQEDQTVEFRKFIADRAFDFEQTKEYTIATKISRHTKSWLTIIEIVDHVRKAYDKWYQSEERC